MRHEVFEYDNDELRSSPHCSVVDLSFSNNQAVHSHGYWSGGFGARAEGRGGEGLLQNLVYSCSPKLPTVPLKVSDE